MTPRMWNVLRAIDARIAAHGYSPTLQEIAVDIGVTARSNAFEVVQNLVTRGYLDREGPPAARRNIAITPAGRAALAAQTPQAAQASKPERTTA